MVEPSKLNEHLLEYFENGHFSILIMKKDAAAFCNEIGAQKEKYIFNAATSEQLEAFGNTNRHAVTLSNLTLDLEQQNDTYADSVDVTAADVTAAEQVENLIDLDVSLDNITNISVTNPVYEDHDKSVFGLINFDNIQAADQQQMPVAFMVESKNNEANSCAVNLYDNCITNDTCEYQQTIDDLMHLEKYKNNTIYEENNNICVEKRKKSTMTYFPSEQMKAAHIQGYSFEALNKISEKFGKYWKTGILNAQNYCDVFKILLKMEDIENLALFSPLAQENVSLKQIDSREFYFELSTTLNIKEFLKPHAVEAVVVPFESYNLTEANYKYAIDKLLPHEHEHSNDIKLRRYVGIVVQVTCKIVYIKFTKNQLLPTDIINTKYHIIFRPLRSSVCAQFEALKMFEMSENLKTYLFPTIFTIGNANTNNSNNNNNNLELFHKNIANDIEQLTAVKTILNGPNIQAPYIIYGPPGTGKTSVIVESILQLYHQNANNRILVTAATNNICDVISLNLFNYLKNNQQSSQEFETNQLFRIYEKYDINNITDQNLLKISNYKNEKVKNELSIHELHKYRIIIATLCTVAKTLNGVYFSHIFIDDAASSTEPETLLGIVGVKSQDTHVILSGDCKQMGPVIKSSDALRFGLGQTLMERLMATRCYAINQQQNESYDFTLQIHLKRNYRAHPKILSLYNELYYNNQLIADVKSANLMTFENWEMLPNARFPVIFQTVNNEINDDESSTKIMWYLHNLFMIPISGLNVKTTDIGIITPCKMQCKLLQYFIENDAHYMGIEIGNVYAFQGREKEIIIVALEKSYADTDAQRRLNVALSRAKSLIILIGNSTILSKFHDLRFIIDKCRVYRSLIVKKKDDNNNLNDDERMKKLKNLPDSRLFEMKQIQNIFYHLGKVQRPNFKKNNTQVTKDLETNKHEKNDRLIGRKQVAENDDNERFMQKQKSDNSKIKMSTTDDDCKIHNKILQMHNEQNSKTYKYSTTVDDYKMCDNDATKYTATIMPNSLKFSPKNNVNKTEIADKIYISPSTPTFGTTKKNYNYHVAELTAQTTTITTTTTTTTNNFKYPDVRAIDTAKYAEKKPMKYHTKIADNNVNETMKTTARNFSKTTTTTTKCYDHKQNYRAQGAYPKNYNKRNNMADNSTTTTTTTAATWSRKDEETNKQKKNKFNSATLSKILTDVNNKMYDDKRATTIKNEYKNLHGKFEKLERTIKINNEFDDDKMLWEYNNDMSVDNWSNDNNNNWAETLNFQNFDTDFNENIENVEEETFKQMQMQNKEFTFAENDVYEFWDETLTTISTPTATQTATEIAIATVATEIAITTVATEIATTITTTTTTLTATPEAVTITTTKTPKLNATAANVANFNDNNDNDIGLQITFLSDDYCCNNDQIYDNNASTIFHESAQSPTDFCIKNANDVLIDVNVAHEILDNIFESLSTTDEEQAQNLFVTTPTTNTNAEQKVNSIDDLLFWQQIQNELNFSANSMSKQQTNETSLFIGITNELKSNSAVSIDDLIPKDIATIKNQMVNGDDEVHDGGNVENFNEIINDIDKEQQQQSNEKNEQNYRNELNEHRNQFEQKSQNEKSNENEPKVENKRNIQYIQNVKKEQIELNDKNDQNNENFQHFQYEQNDKNEINNQNIRNVQNEHNDLYNKKETNGQSDQIFQYDRKHEQNEINENNVIYELNEIKEQIKQIEKDKQNNKNIQYEQNEQSEQNNQFEQIKTNDQNTNYKQNALNDQNDRNFQYEQNEQNVLYQQNVQYELIKTNDQNTYYQQNVLNDQNFQYELNEPNNLNVKYEQNKQNVPLEQKESNDENVEYDKSYHPKESDKNESKDQTVATALDELATTKTVRAINANNNNNNNEFNVENFIRNADIQFTDTHCENDENIATYFYKMASATSSPKKFVLNSMSINIIRFVAQDYNKMFKNITKKMRYTKFELYQLNQFVGTADDSQPIQECPAYVFDSDYIINWFDYKLEYNAICLPLPKFISNERMQMLFNVIRRCEKCPKNYIPVLSNIGKTCIRYTREELLNIRPRSI